ncbi:MAG TPA: TetR/AcrR family transcriptional regulator [Caulobacteraceae bacterium]|nr:TetR/AcrR family transcriptional regulator [Caulobacteraceae bacterium]
MTLRSIADEPDGRRRRSLTSRARIVEAMLDLVREGELSPVAEQVANRAGVGLRTVFRHFQDVDSLYREMALTMEAELMEFITRPFQGDTPLDRVLELIERRSQGFERIAPFRRAALANRHRSPFLAGQSDRLSKILRHVLERELPQSLRDDWHRLELLDLLLSYEAWDRLRQDQGLTVSEARSVLERAARRVLGD